MRILYQEALNNFISEMKRSTNKLKDDEMQPRYTTEELTKAFDLIWVKRASIVRIK